MSPVDDSEAIRLYTADSLSCKEVGRCLGVSEKVIRRIVLAAGVMRPPGRSGPGSAADTRREASRLFHVEGIKNRAKIARMLGIAYRAVHRAVDLRLHLHKDSVG